ncbi:MAG: hypothetical protein ACLFPR_03240 [Desulfococcaceae bacterium]
MTPIGASAAYTMFFGSNKKPKYEWKNLSPKEQYVADVAYWYGTLLKPGSSWKGDLLKRMWAMIWYGGLWMRSGESGVWKAWAHTNLPIASCLSHGGRVLVQLTRDEGSGQVWDWLWGGQRAQSRLAGTHGVAFGHYGSMPDGRPKYVKETKSGKPGTHFGVNFAGGGDGNINPISGKRISENGRHGHLYICYVAPTREKRGALLFGAEDTAPIDRADVQANQIIGGIVGNVPLLPLSILDLSTGGGWKRQPLSPGLRSVFPKGQTGAYHAWGVSGSHSLTGGQKFKKLYKKLHLDVPSGNDQVFVNPPVDVWEKLLNNELTFDIHDLGKTPPAVSPRIVHVMPTRDQFYKATYVGKLHRRNQHLRNMGKLLERYSKLTDFEDRTEILMEFYWEAYEYLRTSKDPRSVKEKVKEYAKMAVDLSG